MSNNSDLLDLFKHVETDAAAFSHWAKLHTDEQKGDLTKMLNRSFNGFVLVFSPQQQDDMHVLAWCARSLCEWMKLTIHTVAI